MIKMRCSKGSCNGKVYAEGYVIGQRYKAVKQFAYMCFKHYFIERYIKRGKSLFNTYKILSRAEKKMIRQAEKDYEKNRDKVYRD